MPTRVAPLLPSTVQSAKPRAKQYKLADGRGLFLLVQPRGGKWWRFVYGRPDTGKRNTLSLGTFPDVSLSEARERRNELRALLADGIDPGAIRKSEAAALNAKRKLAAFSVSLSPAGALSVTVAKKALHLTRLQTDAVRAALLANPE